MYQAKIDPEDLPLNERGDLSYAIDENGESYTPEWYTLNLKAAFFFNKHLSITGGVENITNQLYRTTGSGISASGRNFLISVKATF
jgi:hemoglobin/transferrin/lactoferrin receptor protein